LLPSVPQQNKNKKATITMLPSLFLLPSWSCCNKNEKGEGNVVVVAFFVVAK